jgi:hypothetical protein
MVNVLRKVLVDGYGSGDQAKPGMGWEMQWDSETNHRAAFRSSDPLSTQIWLYVDDTGTIGAGGNRWARAWGMGTFSGWDAGEPQFTGRFPLDAQLSFGVTIAKNRNENSDVVPWIIVASERSFYLMVDHYKLDGFTSEGYGSAGSTHFFGDIRSRKQEDDYRFAVCGGRAENYTSSISIDSNWKINQYDDEKQEGLYLARSHDMLGVSAEISNVYIGYRPGYNVWSGSDDDIPYPCPITGRIVMENAGIMEHGNTKILRGYWPGHKVADHNLGKMPVEFPIRKEVTTETKTFVFIRSAFRNMAGGFFLDMTGPWYDY